jgi:hypothetical protein
VEYLAQKKQDKNKRQIMKKKDYFDVIEEINGLMDKNDEIQNIIRNSDSIIKKIDVLFNTIVDPDQIIELCPVEMNRNIGVTLYETYIETKEFIFIRGNIRQYEKEKYLFADIIYNVVFKFPPLESLKYYAIEALSNIANRLSVLISDGSGSYLGNRNVQMKYLEDINLDALYSRDELERLIYAVEYFCKIGGRFAQDIEEALSYNENDAAGKGPEFIDKIYITLLSLLKTIYTIGLSVDKLFTRDLIENYQGYDGLKYRLDEE